MSLKEDVISHTFHSVPVCSYTFPQSTVSRNVMSFCFCISSAGENMFQAPPTCAAATVTPSHCSYNTFKRQRQTTPTHTHTETQTAVRNQSPVCDVIRWVSRSSDRLTRLTRLFLNCRSHPDEAPSRPSAPSSVWMKVIQHVGWDTSAGGLKYVDGLEQFR